MHTDSTLSVKGWAEPMFSGCITILLYLWKFTRSSRAESSGRVWVVIGITNWNSLVYFVQFSWSEHSSGEDKDVGIIYVGQFIYFNLTWLYQQWKQKGFYPPKIK